MGIVITVSMAMCNAVINRSRKNVSNKKPKKLLIIPGASLIIILVISAKMIINSPTMDIRIILSNRRDLVCLI